MNSQLLSSISTVLLVNLFACSPRDAVTVSGAVIRPGDVEYRSEWTAENYIAAAGGYLAEADTGRVALVREAGDSNISGKQGTVQKWEIGDIPPVMPGDLINVPLKMYEVRFDRVFSVRNLRLEWKDRDYRLERGLAVPGRTARGVVALVIFGKGEVVGKSTGKAAHTFQYLYLTMHPDKYDGLLSVSRETIADREALEDAEGLHRSLFRKSAFWHGKLARLPPGGHFRVQAGVWLMPKNPSYPGRGVRKKHYDDGRVWTTFPDGRQRWRHADGRIVMRFPDNTREVRLPDGSVRIEDTRGGVRTTYPDGRMVFKDADGNRHRLHKDGSQEWRLVSGNRITKHPDGRRVHRFASGTVRTVHPDGVERTVFSDGTRHVLYPNGKVENVVPGGVRETRYPDGRVVAITPQGDRITVSRDGWQLTQMKDGTTIEQFPDGRKIQKHPSGETLEVFADRSRRTVYSDGAETVRRPDGVRVAKLADGTVIEEFPDGRILQTDTTGVQIEFLTPDRYVITDREGNRVEARPDLTASKQFAEPYRFRGSIRRDLIRLERVPERISPGTKVSILGSLVDEALALSMAVFALPDGDVQDMEILLEAGHFEGTLKITETGFYRLQIQCEMNSGEVVMLEDRMLQVGDPMPLDKAPIEISPYKDDAAASRRLMGMVNQARAGKARIRLEWDDDLARAAASHLQEMLAYGSISHLSPMYGDLASRLERLDIPFELALENLATAPSLEEAHWYLMLSAEQRRNILDPRLTHIGVAAVREFGQVWVVEIFKGKE